MRFSLRQRPLPYRQSSLHPGRMPQAADWVFRFCRTRPAFQHAASASEPFRKEPLQSKAADHIMLFCRDNGAGLFGSLYNDIAVNRLNGRHIDHTCRNALLCKDFLCLKRCRNHQPGTDQPDKPCHFLYGVYSRNEAFRSELCIIPALRNSRTSGILRI